MKGPSPRPAEVLAYVFAAALLLGGVLVFTSGAGLALVWLWHISRPLVLLCIGAVLLALGITLADWSTK